MNHTKITVQTIIYIGLSCVLLTGCNSRPSHLEQALKIAGENRAEMEKVLAHYKNEPLKLKAAEFLIENMPGHYSYKNQDWLNAYYHEVSDSVSPDYDNKTNQSIIENISKKYEGKKTGELVFDIHVLTANYLIDNIEKSFAVWPGEWATHVSFDDFCEYILPYKGVEMQPLDNWREYTREMLNADLNTLPYCGLYKNLAVKAATSVNKEIINLQHQEFPPGNMSAIPIKDVRTLTGMPFGSCDDYTIVALAVMRSKGIPVVEDYTPQWPFQAGKHSWNIVLDNYGKNVVFSAGFTNPGEPHKPDEKMAKVFRHTYAINREIRALRSAEKHVPSAFANPFIKDVSGEYMGVVDVEIEISPTLKNEHKYAYLAVFDNKNWIPVQYGKISGKKAEFKQMGKMCMYLPVFYDESGVKPFTAPFHIAYDGRIEWHKPDTSHLQTIAVRRKYFTGKHCYDVGLRLQGGLFQAANKSDFSDAVILDSITGFTIQSGELFLDNLQSKYRYWRYYSADGQYNNMAEMYFYEDENMPPIYGEIIGTNGSINNLKIDEKTAVFDNDPLTYYDAATPSDSWVGMDFGRPVKIHKISYTPRGDGNDVTPGDVHELLYWADNRWNSLGKKTATDIKLMYKDAPFGTIYWIRNLSRGREERIFTYENGGQTWR